MTSLELFNNIIAIEGQVASNTIAYSQAIETLQSYDLSTVVEVPEYGLDSSIKLVAMYIKYYQDRLDGIPRREDTAEETTE